MAWYYGTFSCGHNGRVNVIGPGKDRDWKIEKKFSGLCPECYEKEKERKRKEEMEEAKKASIEMEFPELSGTEKQVAWATLLRIQKVKDLEKFHKEISEEYKDRKPRVSRYGNKEEAESLFSILENGTEMIEFSIQNIVEAKFWIDNRNKGTWETFEKIKKKYDTVKSEEEIPEEVKEEMKLEELRLTAAPIEVAKSGVVKLEYSNRYLKAWYPKDDDFRKIVKSCGFRWDGVWRKEITEYTGDATDRAAELGNKLLQHGFTVCFYDDETKEKAISATFSKEFTSWIKWNVDKKEFSLSWEGYNDRLYQAAKRLPSAKWRTGTMHVSIEFYKEVLDFAETMNFGISKRANREIEKYIEKEKNFETVNAMKPDRRDSPEEKLRKKLQTSGVIEDLRDEDEA